MNTPPVTCEGYILCGTPRSGSTLLCRMLADTGCAGRPNSFFRPEDIADWAEDWGVPGPVDLRDRGFVTDYLDGMIREGSAGTGVFGLRLMAQNLPGAMAVLALLHPDTPDDPARLRAAFGRLGFVYLTRADKVAQAVSLIMAQQSGLWHRSADGSELERNGPPQTPTYDRALIADMVRMLAVSDKSWQEWFDRHEIAPLRLTYESIAQDPRRALGRVLAHIGLPDTLVQGIAPDTAPLSNAVNRDWIARFRNVPERENHNRRG